MLFRWLHVEERIAALSVCLVCAGLSDRYACSLFEGSRGFRCCKPGPPSRPLGPHGRSTPTFPPPSPTSCHSNGTLARTLSKTLSIWEPCLTGAAVFPLPASNPANGHLLFY